MILDCEGTCELEIAVGEEAVGTEGIWETGDVMGTSGDSPAAAPVGIMMEIELEVATGAAGVGTGARNTPAPGRSA